MKYDDFTVLVREDGRRHWVSRCTMAITFKMTEQVELQICIKFCDNLEHYLCETIWMIQNSASMGSFIMTAHLYMHHASCRVFGETSNHWDDSDTLQLRFGTRWLLNFPKLKSSLKRKRFQTVHEIQENMTEQLMVIRRTVWGLNAPTLKGTAVSLSYVQYFLCLVSSSINISIF